MWCAGRAQANGITELHKLTPPLAVLQNKGFRVALVTDGRMSGASGQGARGDSCITRSAGRRPAGKVVDGDVIRLDAPNGVLQVAVPETEWGSPPAGSDATSPD